MHTIRPLLITLTCTLLFFAPNLYAVQCSNNSTFLPATENAWSGWGGNAENTRNNDATSNPIHAEQLPNLKLKWAFAFPDANSVIGNPALMGGRIFIGAENGQVYSLDAESGCIYWTFQASNGVRTTPLIKNIDGKWLVFFGDRNTNFYALDAISGKQLWQTKIENHRAAILTGTPQFVHMQTETIPNRLFIPVSSSEEGLAIVPSYACCSFRGSVVSIDASNGNKLWQSHTITQVADETSKGSFGPSGAAIWSAPTIDIDMQRLYVTTGDAYSAPADIATDAVIAMDLLSGDIQWIKQGTANDIWTAVCLGPNAPDNCGPDQDFGAPGMLVSANDQQFLLSGQKSSIVRAHDRSTGEVFWQTALAENTTEFGGKIVWGGASDANTAYFGMGTGIISALNLTDGSLQWSSTFTPPTGREKHIGQDGPVTLSHDVLFSGGWDGILRALAKDTGEVLWQYDTAKEFDTVNGVPGQGGSMGAVGQIVNNGYLLVPSGYRGVKSGMPGNVLLVFSLNDD